MLIISGCFSIDNPGIEKKEYTAIQKEGIRNMLRSLNGKERKCVLIFLTEYSEKWLEYCLQEDLYGSIGGGCYHESVYLMHTAVEEAALETCIVSHD